MKWLPLSIMLIASCGLIQASEEIEPPLGHVLQIGQEKIRLEPGKELQINGNFDNPKLKLIPDLERQFNAAGVQFKYPAYFTFEADFTTEGIRIWTLGGKQMLLMLQAMDGVKVSAQEMADSMKDEYGKKAKTAPLTRKIGGKQMEGVRISADLAMVKLQQDIFALPSKNGSRFLIVQDTTEGEAAFKAEKDDVNALLDKTLRLSDPPSPAPRK
jgi:hypothetical protein